MQGRCDLALPVANVMDRQHTGAVPAVWFRWDSASDNIEVETPVPNSTTVSASGPTWVSTRLIRSTRYCSPYWLSWEAAALSRIALIPNSLFFMIGSSIDHTAPANMARRQLTKAYTSPGFDPGSSTCVCSDLRQIAVGRGRPRGAACCGAKQRVSATCFLAGS